jgi:ABC-type bacteriocin/lantibiotic exporter with double-glycine peptidase domain
MSEFLLNSDSSDEATKAFEESVLERSLLGILYTKEEYLSLWPRFRIETVPQGQVVFNEGDSLSDLVIIISGEVTLFSGQINMGGDVIGKLISGRSAALHALMRGLPAPYSGFATTELKILRVDWSLIEQRLASLPSMYTSYLKFLTENPFMRSLSKELDELGCTKPFKIEFLGAFQKVEFSAHRWILKRGNIPDFTFIFSSGTVTALQSSNEKIGESPVASVFAVPARTWVAWNELVAKTPCAQSYRTATDTTLYMIRSKTIENLKSRFPADFDLLENWVSSGTDGVEGDPKTLAEEREEVDVSSLFKNGIAKKRSFFSSYPWIPQDNEMDCGPACLTMLSSYHGASISIQEWRHRVKPNRNGCSLFDLATVAEDLGFEAHGIYCESLDDVDESMLPAIALRQYHFVVIYEINQKYLLIGDPSAGVIKMPRAKFLEGFERTLLLLKPTAQLQDIKRPTSQYGHYLELFKGYGREMSMVVFASLFLTLIGVIPPILSQLVMDEVLVQKNLALLFYLVGSLLVVGVLQNVMEWVRSYYIQFVAVKFDFSATSYFLKKTFSLPYSFMSRHHLGDFTRRISEMERLREFATSTLLGTFLSLLTLVIYGCVLIYYSPTVALMTFLLAPVQVIISMLFTKKLLAAYRETFTSRSEEESLLSDLLKGVTAIKALTGELAARWRIEEKVLKTLKARYGFVLTANALGCLSGIYALISRLSILGFAAYLGIKGQLTPGQVLSVTVFANFVIAPFQDLANTWSGVQEVKTTMNRLNDVFLTPSEAVATNAVRKERLRGEIEFQDVWFRYGGEASPWVLKGVSFKVEPGSKIAIVGPSGSGKSTIANLLLRLFEPTQGQIFIDGRDYREYDTAWLRNQLGLILQESHLFNGTIKENIAFNDPSPNLERVAESAARAGAQTFIEAKPGGYNYFISHSGFGLSGGEKQRISCARAIYANPGILILDEATSALDGVAERDLMQGILGTFSAQTVISIAHRFTTVRYFDRLIVMNSGKVVDSGSHDYLRVHSELYRTLFGLQELKVA